MKKLKNPKTRKYSIKPYKDLGDGMFKVNPRYAYNAQKETSYENPQRYHKT